MLLLHQTGSVKIGEVVRYIVTYKPSADHILPSPEFLYLRIKNTCAIALRAAFVHGPYTLSVAAVPSTFKPFEKFENPRRYGVPEFEPMLKPGAVWNCHLVVPDNIRQSAGEGSSQHGHFGAGPGHDEDAVSWVIEITSQVIFSASASVHYEILLARDEKSLSPGSVIPIIGSQAQAPQPGHVSDFQRSAGAYRDHPAQPKGVFSKAIHLKVEDTAALWNTPQLPGWDEMGWLRARENDGADAPVESVMDSAEADESRRRSRHRQKKVHLVILTHGLHSNLGSDMLFLKESIDAAAKQARIDAKARKAKERIARSRARHSAGDASPAVDGSGESSQAPTAAPGFGEADGQANGQGQSGETDAGDIDDDDDDDDEEVVVRGYSGNATKTERGIKYLGKRLARYILSMTYPDQPCLPTAKAASEAIAHSLKTSAQKKAVEEAHKHSSVHHMPSPAGGGRLYKFTKISFIGHSLGGLVQTYAIAYIQKHSPRFFELIEPVNFIALASPFLGLNHENPLYVKFALDFGLVGRTGQDLGLTWRAPTIARSGWSALVSNLGEQAQKRVYGEPQPESKPLLRILPTGPAHKALKKFRNRTVYSNVVNDGIVPLRTSCLLFLDWQGLGRVEKARREAGLVETVVGFGWAELTGATVTTPRLAPWSPDQSEDKDEASSTGKTTPAGPAGDSHEVPQPPTNATLEDDRQSLRSMTGRYREASSSELQSLQGSGTTTSNPFAGFFNFFRSESPKPPPAVSPKVSKIYKRSQTLKADDWLSPDPGATSKSKVTAGDELSEEPESVSAPPRTTIFESAGDLLNPKLPSIEFIIDPSKRPRTIFHDRVYHPSDIPPPPLKQRSSSPLTLLRWAPTASSSQKTARSETSSPAPFQSADRKDSSPLSPQSNPANHPASGSDESTPNILTFERDTTHPPTSEQHPPSQQQQQQQQQPPPPPPLPEEDYVDTSQMRVEEKIARAYHSGLSWRKVLVKLEPDAHNNIVVRRTFANAFGWPVVQHLVEAHFSDAARVAENVRQHETVTMAGAGGGAHEKAKANADAQGVSAGARARAGADAGDGREEDGRGAGGGGADSGGEEADMVPELLPSPRSDSGRGRDHNALGLFAPGTEPGAGPASPTTPRPNLDRLDSVSWSERDWLDSADESDDGGGGPRTADTKSKRGSGGLGIPFGGERSSSPWSWTEKIVGKGAAGRSKSPGEGRK
ncbi:51641925-fea4-44f5-9baf-6c0363c00152 [Thermothielavioides terrestris]|nr:51641925-fea4-44f5-9baf-6c0363c00152 [Thermothielavioides terrestris]